MPATLRAVRPRRLLGLTVAAAALAVSACDDDEKGGTLLQPLASPALVKIVHAAPSLGSVVVSIDGGAPILSNFLPASSAPDAFGRYLEVPDGQRTIRVVRSDSGTTAIEGTATLTALQNYSVIAVGRAGGTGNAARRLIVLTDDVTAPAANQVRLRIVHVATGTAAASVDVHTSPPSTGTATAPVFNWTRRAQNVTPGNATTVTAASGALAICVVPAGTAPAANASNCVIAPGNTATATTGTLAAGTVATTYIMDNNAAATTFRFANTVDRRP
jgi:hypothetical protein